MLEKSVSLTILCATHNKIGTFSMDLLDLKMSFGVVALKTMQFFGQNVRTEAIVNLEPNLDICL